MGQNIPKPEIPEKGQLFKFDRGHFLSPAGTARLRRILTHSYPDLGTEMLSDDELRNTILEFVSEDYLHEDEPELWRFIFGDTGQEIHLDYWEVKPMPMKKEI
jgi:hypothetical protein